MIEWLSVSSYEGRLIHTEGIDQWAHFPIERKAELEAFAASHDYFEEHSPGLYEIETYQLRELLIRPRVSEQTKDKARNERKS